MHGDDEAEDDRTRLVPSRLERRAPDAPRMPIDDPEAPVFWGDATFAPDQVLAGSFVVKTLISRGGMGEIYRVRHRDLGTDHAIKILRPAMLQEPSAVALLLDEARVLQHIRHDAIVSCRCLLRDDDGRSMLLLDYLRGTTLAVRMLQGPVGAEGLRVLLVRLLDALEALQGYGIVHQDLSPDNVVIRNDSLHEATLIDFGVARVLHEIDGAHGAIDFAGKYSWASPEQLDPERAGAIGPRSDVYSLGLTIAAVARGQKLDMGHDLDSALAARRRRPALDGVPPEIAPHLTRMLNPDPRRRPDAATIRAGLGQAPRPGFRRRLLRRLLGGLPGGKPYQPAA